MKIRFLNGFWLKLIAIVAMTVDHLGLVLNMFYLTANDPIVSTCRIIGRLALPLFCFMIAEGMKYSKKKPMYLLRLGIMAVIISITLLVMTSSMGFAGTDFGNIFLDLFMGALAIYCLQKDKWYIKLLAILPLAFCLTSFGVSTYETTKHATIHWFPEWIRVQYGFYGIAMILGFYGMDLLKNVIMKMYAQKTLIEVDTLKDMGFERKVSNVLNAFVILFFTLIFFMLSHYLKMNYLDVQIWAILSGALLLFYNGKRGYNGKVFQYGCYVYYPLHILIIYGIFFL